ncbi:spliceosome-associated protein 49 [Purpureocillium lavendulum]|uniref:Spliceosome-associated protein 49 n=1 Tax=Purpureocillium lavendulum TaxID=1247861 RepID=A0AB34FJB4_9HYPO|nr:spliceosome-associated protein 49 [Purpureocillium lavendulum]
MRWPMLTRSATTPREQDKEATVYIGNIDERASTAMVYEIMLQMGPIHNIHMPRDRVTQNHQGFGFVEFRGPQDAEYAAQVMNGIKLFGKPLRVNKASADKQKGTDVGAELFVGNLDHVVDEKLLYDTFSRFGPLLSLPKVARDDSGNSKGFGFVGFADFDSSDAAIDNLNGQYLLSKEISVQYAFKKDGRGERHGDEAERQLAAQAKLRNIVPDAQPIPQAFLQQQQQPTTGANATPTTGGHGAPPGTNLAHPQGPPPGFDPSAVNGGLPPPPGVVAGGMPPHAHAPPPHHHAVPPPHGMPVGFAPPPQHRGGPSPYGGGGQFPPPPAGARGSAPLGPPPAGLPARPPPSPVGFANPADYHPGGFRPPNGSPAQQGFPAPPPGFPGPPPPGATGTPPAMPPGFQPPPGYQQPPPGFPRR